MMRKVLIAAVTAALVLGGAPAMAKEKETGEQKLAKMLDGYTAGEPVRCIRTNSSDNMQIIDKTAIVYKVGKTIYVNRTAHPDTLDWDDVLVIKRFDGSQLCRLDQVSTIDRGSHAYTGAVFLEDFVPYTKAKG